MADDESRGVWRLPPAEAAGAASRAGGALSGGKRARPAQQPSDDPAARAGKGVVALPRGAFAQQPAPWHSARELMAGLQRLHSSTAAAAPPGGGGGGGGGGGAQRLPAHAPAFFSPPSASPLLRLHEEILDFCAFMGPTPSEVAIAGRALAAVHGVIAALFPAAAVEVFGSRALGLVLPTSDWDLVCAGVAGTGGNMRRLAGELTARGVARRTEVIDSARVPIVKVWEAASGICVDISFEGAAASARSSRGAMTELMARFPPARPLALVLKYFLLQRGLNDTFSGGIGSYLLVLMSVAVVQAALRGARSEGSSGSGSGSGSGSSSGASASAAATAHHASAAVAARAGGADLNLGALLLSALELYGRTLNMHEVGISLRGELGGLYSKAARGWADARSPFMLSVESPVDATQDVGRGAWGIQKCRRALAAAHCSLSRAVRAWGAHAGGGGGGGGSGGGPYGVVVAPAAPASLLASVLRVDDLLRLRLSELEAQKEEAEAAVGGGGGGAGSKRRARGAEAGEPPPPGEGGGEGSGGGSGGGGSGAEVDTELDVDTELEEEEEEEGEGGSGSSSSSGAGRGALPLQAQQAPAAAGAASAAAASPSAADFRAAAVARLEGLAGGGGGGGAGGGSGGAGSGSGVQLRHKRLLSDILTRRERGVPGVLAAPDGWY